MASGDLQSLPKDKEDPIYQGAHMVTVLPHSLTLPADAGHRADGAQLMPGPARGQDTQGQ